MLKGNFKRGQFFHTPIGPDESQSRKEGWGFKKKTRYLANKHNKNLLLKKGKLFVSMALFISEGFTT